MSKIKKLAGDTIWYGLSSIVGRVISYVLTPLYTAVFLPGEFGIVTEFFAYVAFLNIIYMYGMETAYFRFATKHKDQSQAYFNLCVSSIIVTSLLFSALLIIAAKPLVTVLGYPGREIIIYWLALTIAIDCIYAIPFAKLRLDGRPKRFAFIRLANVIIAVLLNLFFLVFCDGIVKEKFLPELRPLAQALYTPDFNIKYVFLSTLISNSLFIIFLSDQFSSFRFTFNWGRFKPILVYALPILLIGIAGTANEMMSRTLLKYILPENFYQGRDTLHALGVFGACYKLSVFMMLGIQAFRYAAEPFFFTNAGEKDSPALLSKVMQAFVIFNCLVFLGVTANLEPLGIAFLSNPEYREGLYIVPFLLMGYLLLGIFYNLSVWYKVTDKTHFGAIITCTGALVTIVANLLLIPVLGYFGSALTTLFTYLIMTVMSYFMGQKHYPIPYNVGNALGYIVLSSALSYIAYQTDCGNIWLNMLCRNTIVLVFAAFILYKERKALSNIPVLGKRLF